MKHDQETEFDGDEAEPLPPQIRPYWSRNRHERHEHEIDILLAGLAGAVLTALILMGFIHG